MRAEHEAGAENAMIILTHDRTNRISDLQKSATKRIVDALAATGYDISHRYMNPPQRLRQDMPPQVIQSFICGTTEALNHFSHIYSQISESIQATLAQPVSANNHDLAEGFFSEIQDYVDALRKPIGNQ